MFSVICIINVFDIPLQWLVDWSVASANNEKLGRSLEARLYDCSELPSSIVVYTSSHSDEQATFSCMRF